MKVRSKKSENEHFTKLANEWWSESGKYKILHNIREGLDNFFSGSFQILRKSKVITKSFSCLRPQPAPVRIIL